MKFTFKQDLLHFTVGQLERNELYLTNNAL